MEIAIAMGFLVGVFVLLGGAILFFPYDKGDLILFFPCDK